MLTCNDYNKLISYESKLHASGIDTMNRWYAKYEQRRVKEAKKIHQQQQTKQIRRLLTYKNNSTKEQRIYNQFDKQWKRSVF